MPQIPIRSGRKKQAAEEALGGGDRQRAMELFARAGDWKNAAQLAAEVGDDEKLVRYSLLAAFGRVPEGGGGTLLQAGGLLASKGHAAAAVPLFERARDFFKAGEAALAAGQTERAVTFFKQDGAWLQAIRAHEDAGKLAEALHTAEEGVLSLQRTIGGTSAGAGRIEEINAKRAHLLVRLGRGDAAAKLLRTMPPSPRVAELLERAGRYVEAFHRYLELGRTEDAARVAARTPNRQRLLAQLYLQTGRPVEAGHLLSQLGLAREAAEAYTAAQQWGWAAYRWEAAREPLRAAECYEKAGRLRDAARCYESAGLLERAAETHTRAGNAEQAIALQVRGGRAIDAARTYLAAGDKARAASLLIPLRPEEPGFADGAVLLAPLLLDEGFAEDALSRLRRIPAVPQELEVERGYWEGRCLETLGRSEEAAAAYERVAAREPGHRDAGERLQRLAGTAAPEVAVEPTMSILGPPAVADADLPVVGKRLAGRYEILADLGRGGMGKVYKARDLELGEVVAIKTVLAPAEGGKGDEARFLREVQICRRISHPNVVRVYDIGRFAAGLFVTMEYLEGQSLEDMIGIERALPLARVRALLLEIAAGLHEAHSQGIVHRDLKPTNVMVTANRLKILDFGIASMAGLGARLTQAGVVMGSPMYISPEQILGDELDGRSDLYSLGIIAFMLIAGREPFDAADANALLSKHLREKPPDVRTFRPDTPPEWAALLDRLLAKEPDKRYQSAAEVLKVLAALPV
jgi:eukaryotic-like serine/threonine-protein kinase